MSLFITFFLNRKFVTFVFPFFIYIFSSFCLEMLGFDASCGEYITFIDADDRIPNNYLEILYETIIESGVDLSICTITKIWHSGKKRKYNYLEVALLI